jgi:hypoxanthine phosphoribosyltransferase
MSLAFRTAGFKAGRGRGHRKQAYNDHLEHLSHRVILDKEGLAQGLGELAGRLEPLLEGKEVTVVPIMGGAMFFAADLVRRLPPGLVMDFLRIQTYGDAKSSQRRAKIDWTPHEGNIRDKTVLLLDDILDTGRTMVEARRFLLEEMGAGEVIVVVMVDKPIRRAVDIQADDYVIKIEEDLFLVGCGLDLAGKFRNLPEILALDESELL